MRTRLAQSVLAMVLAVTVAMTGTARPASAAPVRVQYDVGTIIAVAKGLIDIWKSFKGGGLTLQAATQQILNAINTAKTDIIAHLDRLAAADARACAERHVIELADIEHFTTDTLQAWAQNATACVTQIDSLIGTVTDKAAQDVLGSSLDIVGPIALIARTRAGFSTDGLKAVLIGANNKVITALMPYCVFISGFQPPYITHSVCIAYNGDRADVMNKYYDDNLRMEAMRNTSWVVAKYAVPNLSAT